MKHILDGKRVVLGTCYYPEHWAESLWSEDLDRMLNVGIETIRVAEFAWSKVEPTEGNFVFDFWDRFLDLCDTKGMKVIFCTPTATPPAWLTEKYPEVLNADINGTLFRHGSRRHYNYNSPKYREKSRIITEVFASHYANRKCIIGWQLDNELNCETGEFYSEADSDSFRQWLVNKYKTLDALNDAWGTVFWNQTYTDWREVYVPRKTVNGANNQHQRLDYLRFVSDSCRSFAKEQSDILRRYIKEDDFITTNGLFGHLDNHAMARESLDFYMYDSYPNFSNRVTKTNHDEFEDRWWSHHLTETRSISPIFGIMEQQTGANGWTIWDGVPTPRPGQICLWAMQSIAHGADFVSFFRWRTCTFGTEIYWHGILDYSGRDNERLAEIAEINGKVSHLKSVAGKQYDAKVCVLRDYDNNFDAEIDRWHGSLEGPSQNALFRALQKTHTPFDYVYFYEGGLSAELSKYKAVFWPHPVIASEMQAAELEKYVENGGILIIGARAGYKDDNGHCVMEKLPGVFAKLTGADVYEYSFIQPDIGKIGVDFEGTKFSAEVFADRISEESSADIVGRYTDEFFAGDGAVTENFIGRGCVYYYGSVFNEKSVKAFLDKLKLSNPYGDIVKVPESVEIAVRGNVMFILNYKNEYCEISFKKPVTDLFSGTSLTGRYSMKNYEALAVRIN